MITLYQFKRAMGVPNASPFCMKLETWLRMSGLPHEVKVVFDPRKAPLGKLPYIEHDGNKIADTSNIIPYLARACDVEIDAGLNESQLAIAHAFQRMLEEHSYWGIVYGRWVDDSVWPQTRKVWFGALPPGIRQLVSRMARKQTIRDAHGQGLSRHSKEEIMHRVGLDITAVATQLADQDFFLGEAPRTIDATIYAFLANFWELNIQWGFPRLVEKHPNLVAYCARMKARYYSDISD